MTRTERGYADLHIAITLISLSRLAPCVAPDGSGEPVHSSCGVVDKGVNIAPTPWVP
jgi:hypothetical protein